MESGFNCPYKCGDTCMEGSGKPSDTIQTKIMEEYRMQSIYQYVKGLEKRFKYIQIILLIQSIAIIATASALIIDQLR